MLALIEDGSTIISQVAAGGWFNLPDGSAVSPAYDGWESGSYRLAEIQPADPVPAGKVIVSTSVQMVNVTPKYVNVLADAVVPVPDSISRRQFYQYLATLGMITKGEALAAIKTGSIPASLQAILDGMTDPDAKFDADMLLSGAAEFNRDHPLVMVFAMQQQMSEEDVDDFWRAAANV